MDNSLTNSLLQPAASGASAPALALAGQTSNSLPNLGTVSSNVGQYSPVTNTGNTPANIPTAPVKQAPWWERALPTAGGVLGSIGGDILGTVAAPFTAGIVNPWDTSSALSGILSGAGKAAENGLTGQSIGKGVLSTALANAGGNLAGTGLSFLGGKALSAGTGALGNVVEGRAAQAAADKVAQDAATQATADATAKTNEIQRLADEFKPQENDKSVTPYIGDTVGTLQNLGFEKPMATDAQKVANVLTGSNDNGAGILNQAKQDVLANSGGTVHLGEAQEAGTPSGNLLANLRDPSSIAQLGDPLKEGASPAQAILDKYEVLAKGAGATNEGMSDVNPTSGFKMLSDVSDEARNASRNAAKLNATPADQATANIWNTLKSDMKTAVYNRPEVNEAVKNFEVTPGLSNQIDQKIAAEGITDPNVAANLKSQITDTLNNGQNMNDWLTQEAKGVKMGQVGDSAGKQQGNITSAASQRLAKGALLDTPEPDTIPVEPNKNNKLGMLDAASIAAAPLTHDKSLIGLVPHAIAAAKNPAVQDKAYSMLSKATNSATAKRMIPLLLRTAGTAGGNLDNDAGTPVSDTIGTNNGNTGMGTSMQQSPEMNTLEQAYNAALAHPYMPGAMSVLASLAPVMQKEQAASSAINTLGSDYANAGGAQGTMGGIMSKLSGLIPGTAANSYNKQQGTTASLLAHLLGVSPQSLMQSMPQLTQTQQTAQPAISNLNSIAGSITPTGTY